MPAVKWSNGQTDKAATWDELLELVRQTQWKPYSEPGFREELSIRAWRWSRTDVDPDLPAERLFLALERAHVVVILNDDEKEN